MVGFVELWIDGKGGEGENLRLGKRERVGMEKREREDERESEKDFWIFGFWIGGLFGQGKYDIGARQSTVQLSAGETRERRITLGMKRETFES